MTDYRPTLVRGSTDGGTLCAPWNRATNPGEAEAEGARWPVNCGPRVNLLRVDRVVVICGNCEAEWSADERPATAPCLRCGLAPDLLSTGWDHVVRVDRVAP